MQYIWNNHTVARESAYDQDVMNSFHSKDQFNVPVLKLNVSDCCETSE